MKSNLAKDIVSHDYILTVQFSFIIVSVYVCKVASQLWLMPP